MNPVGVFKGQTPAQAHGAQSEVQTRSSSPYGVLARSNNTQLMGNIVTRTNVANKQLTAKARHHIAPKNFALPGRRYPVNDAAHARAALSRVSQFGTPEEKAKVRAKVHSKFPGIGK
jgi:hypothetical protein